jgi:twitching motility protein PilT
MELVGVLREAMSRGASDVHLKPRQHPVLRVRGRLIRLDQWAPLEPKELDQIGQAMLTPLQRQRFEHDGGVDMQYTVAGVGRFRASVCRARTSTTLALRVVPYEPPSIEDLNLPPVVAKLAMEPRGLVLVTGPAGAGKTTSLAGMIAHMNRYRNDHIVTIEDPIEYLFEDHSCIITQREVGTDAASFADALRICLRQDPDVVMVGEMRDLETIRTALTLAETGHLVLSTLHTITAAETVNRIISEFPTDHERQVRMQLGQVLRGVISQRLMERADVPGLIPAVEVLVNTLTIQRCIEDPARTGQIPAAIAEGRDTYGMQTFNQSTLDLYQRGLITFETARRNASSATDFEVEVERLTMAADVTPRGPAAAPGVAPGPAGGTGPRLAPTRPLAR